MPDQIQPSPFLLTSARRAIAASAVHTATGGSVDGLLLADVLDLFVGSTLRMAGLDDEQAREVMAILWDAP